MTETTRKMFDLNNQTGEHEARHATPFSSPAQTLWTISSSHLLEPAATLRHFGIRAIYDQHGALVEIPRANPPKLSHWLAHIFDIARAEGVCVISFDKRAEVVEGLPIRGRVTALGLSVISR